uniref:Uncharacterized protein n=1 Tax=Parascaris equorum TaxID=6256 RepID=A0A914RJI1_PAREQ
MQDISFIVDESFTGYRTEGFLVTHIHVFTASLFNKIVILDSSMELKKSQ